MPASAVRAHARLFVRPALGPSVPVRFQRLLLDAVGAVAPIPPATRTAAQALGEVACLRVEHDGADPTRAVLYLHGGGYTVGSPRHSLALAGHLSRAAAAPVYSVDYRLAPEHPYPAALEDAITAYRALVTGGRGAERIAVAGDSAGGGLAVAAALRLRDAGEPVPSALLMICPWLDMTLSSPSVDRNAERDAVLRRSWVARTAARYAGAHDLGSPELSPVNADLAGLPPVAVQSAGDDLLADDAARFADLARQAGVAVEHRRFEGLWHDFQAYAGVMREADAAVEDAGRILRRRWSRAGEHRQTNGAGPRTPSVAIVGSGFAGVGMAMQLKRAGIDSFEIFEREAHLGGTWRDNSYPGSACDVPSHLYQYSFEPLHDWSRRFSPQRDILAYLERCADRYGLHRHISLSTELRRAEFDEGLGRWRLETSQGYSEADVLVAACGQLSDPYIPSLPGLERFKGTQFHSARWDHDHNLAGRSVAVVGTGASAIQLVPEIADRVERLYVFQRSAPYVIPKWDAAYGDWQRRVFERAPLLPALARLGFFAYFEAVIPALNGRLRQLIWPLRLTFEAMFRLQVRDPELRRKLRPDYEMGCKRVLISSDWYPALMQPHVELVTDRIDEVTADRIVTDDGVERPVDTIVFGTGFKSNDFVAPMEVQGLGGREVSDAWRDGAEAYLGLAVAGFPNFFMLYGPNTNLGSGSIIHMLESQIAHVLEAVRALERSGAAYLDVRSDAQAAFSREVQQRLATSVWQTGGCSSWYRDDSGRNTNNWPGFQLEYRRRTRQLDLDDYRLVTTREQEPAAAGQA